MKILIVCSLLLAGCVDTTAYRSAIAGQAAQAADAELDTILWVFCKATPAGAVIRKFGTNTEMWNHYVGLCWQQPIAARDNPPISKKVPD